MELGGRKIIVYPDSKCGGRRRKGSVSVGSEDQGLVDTDMDIRCSSGSGAEPYGRRALCGTTSGTVLSATMTRADCSSAASVCDFSLPRRSLASRPFVLETTNTLPPPRAPPPTFLKTPYSLPCSPPRRHAHMTTIAAKSPSYYHYYLSHRVRIYVCASFSLSGSLSLSTRSVVNVCLTSSRSRLARSTVLVLLCSTPESHKLPRSRSRSHPRAS